MPRSPPALGVLCAMALALGAAGSACAPVRLPRSTFPAPAGVAPPRWRAGFEGGDLSEWTYLLNPRGLSVVEGPAASGRRAGRVEILPTDLWPNGLNRVEVQHKPPPATMAEGQRSCFAWGFLVPAALSDDRHQIGYWESYPSYRQIMSFEVRGQGIAFVTRLPTERVQWRAAGLVTPGVWHQIALCARWSADSTRGAVDVWFDGRRVVTGGRARTLWDNPNLVQIGILRDVPAGPPEVMFLDDALEGPSLDAAGISGAAAAPPTDG
ncbi:MAG TPA: heparin lyase I family protein [Polyangia bacterium]